MKALAMKPCNVKCPETRGLVPLRDMKSSLRIQNRNRMDERETRENGLNGE